MNARHTCDICDERIPLRAGIVVLPNGTVIHSRCIGLRRLQASKHAAIRHDLEPSLS
jgi:hypothetical protein